MAHRLLTAAAALVAALTAFAAPALADCPGGSPTCPYTASGVIGQRAEGVLRFPQALAVAPDGSVFVGDQSSHAIQIFGPDGAFRGAIGVAGNRPGELGAIGSVALAPDGSVLVADGSANRISRFTPGGELLSHWGSGGSEIGQFRFGNGGGNSAAAGGGLAVSGGTVFVVDTGNDRVQRFALDGSGGMELVAPGQLTNPRGIAVRKTRMLVADDQNHRLVVYDTGGHFLRTVGAGPGPGPGQLNFPYDVALDAAGRVFVADDLNQRIVRFSTLPNYPYKARWGSYGTGVGQLAYPRGIDVDGAGNVYVANTGNDRIDVFDPSGRPLRSFGTSGRAPGQFDAPLGVAADASGIRAVTDSVNGRLELLNPDGSLAAVWGSPAPGPTILPAPVAVAFDSGGNAYVLDRRRGRIVLFSRSQGLPVRTIASQGSGPGQLLDPAALAIGPDASLWVADSGNDRVAHFANDGAYLGAIAVDVSTPRGIAVTPDGSRVYVADSSNRITAYDAAGNQIVQFGGTGSKLGKLTSPGQMAIDASGALWVVDRGNNRVQQFGADGERLATFGTRGAAEGQFIHPTGVSVDCHGTLTVTDSDNNRVQQFTLAAPPAATCAVLPPPANPPPPKLPTLPVPPGPALSVRVLRSSGLTTARTLPLRIGADTSCVLTVTGTVTPRAAPPKPKHGKRRQPVVVRLARVRVDLPAGASKIVRLTMSRTSAKALRKALRGRRGLVADVQLTAAAAAGEPTSITQRVNATG